MAGDREELASVVQDDWKEIAAALRGQIRKVLVDQFPDMSSKERKEFIDAAQAAYWLEHNAMTFDSQVDAEMKRRGLWNDD